jgi:hypothetical protein
MTRTQIDDVFQEIRYVMDLYGVEGRIDYNTRFRNPEFVIENYSIVGEGAYLPESDFISDLGLALNELLGTFSYLTAHPDIDGSDISIMLLD